MLKKLYINNYAIIDELSIEFVNQLNIITGETGAGKSIIVGALQLILGQRADSSVLVNKEKKCVVEGVFKVEETEELMELFKQNDWDYVGDEIIVRREIIPTGKSRAFVNDSPTNLSQLLDLSSMFVDLHRQFDTLTLGESKFQLNVLDALAGNASALKNYKNIFGQWQTEKRLWDELLQQKKDFEKEFDYVNFQYTELADANFSEGELEKADEELKLMSNAEGIKSALGNLCQVLHEGESPLAQQIKILYNQLQPFLAMHPGLPTIAERLRSAQIELQDIAGDVETINDKINFEPKKIEQLSERLSLGYRLQKKHGVKTTNELLAIQHQLEEKLKAVLDIDEAIAKHEKKSIEYFEQVVKLANEISAQRQKQIQPFINSTNKLLQQVGMPNAKIKVAVEKTEPNITGVDAVEFLFDANLPSTKSDSEGKFLSIRKVASGGELSRLMLCIKSLVANAMDLPTLIFDEIDSGISGEAAKQVGIIMKSLSKNRQMICITHQPQIAGKADRHFFVYKENTKQGIKTSIMVLNNEEHVLNIAKMIGGEQPSKAALENARELANSFEC